MRGMGSVLIFLIGVMVVYGVYWFNRAVAVSKDAKYVIDNGGSVSDALNFIKSNQSIPDKLRISALQQDYVNLNKEEFFVTQKENILEYMFSLLKQKSIEENFPLDDNDIRYKNACDSAFALSSIIIAKKWCESKGIK